MNKHTRNSRWRKYNQWRSSNRAIDRARREQRRAEKIAAQEAAALAQPPPVAPVPVVRKRGPVVRVTLEADGARRVFRCAYVEGYGWQGDSGNTICTAVRLVLRHAPG
jgi:hypothetical protein